MLAISLGVPVIQLLLLGLAVSTDVEHVPAVISDMDNSVTSRSIVSKLENTPLPRHSTQDNRPSGDHLSPAARRNHSCGHDSPVVRKRHRTWPAAPYFTYGRCAEYECGAYRCGLCETYHSVMGAAANEKRNVQCIDTCFTDEYHRHPEPHQIQSAIKIDMVYGSRNYGASRHYCHDHYDRDGDRPGT